jgi:DNA-binding LacI/PurR family transcriptional regulator
VDGILLLGDVPPLVRSQEEMAAFVREHQHVVTVGCRPRHAGETSISVDNARGVTLALEHLFGLGHRSVAYIGPTEPPVSWEEEQRWGTFARFMEAHGLPWGPEYSFRIRENDLATAQQALQQVLSAPVRPTAAFVINDLSAIVLLKAALIRGLRVPDDLSLIGFDNIQFAALSTPGLTTVSQPIEAMGRYAASLLLDRITGVEPPASPPEGAVGTDTVVFAPDLVCRESTCPPRM